ncbi:MAG: acetylglutamate kinase [Candidatus Margulisbacteria bacterium]|nr:acetylglutamate kinase [Candidatus Margulisiibacteriota bacterium]MBU1022424.1 acetylglutamate kinase [Candidatus Margulisiibacteriota bacterium]MBU1728408.1 acetylglutamate kinase [Candidatus Margulisiibacteriota bacterium]MBU1954555.1 acetylglutamate kinase [Candidatus Margulisiibacteriota bacterium]
MLKKYRHLIRRANVVLEALPYLKQFHDKIIVIKYGGAAMQNDELKREVIQDVVLLKYVGMHPVIVHGGGPEISKSLKRKGIETRFVQGMRFTSKKVLEVVENVLGNKVNAEICRMIRKEGGKPKSYCGKKGKVIKARKLWVKDKNGRYLDLGLIGKAIGIKYRYLYKMIKKGYIPVLSPIGVGRKGQTFNINADFAAAKVAAYLNAEKLILMTDVRGVLNKKGKLISEVDAKKIRRMIDNETISGGMIPKVQCGLTALKHGANNVHIIDGRVPHAVLLELFTDYGIGTMVVK